MLVFTEDCQIFCQFGLIKRIDLSKDFSNLFWEIRKGTNKSIVYVNRYYSLKIGVISRYLKTIAKILPFHKVTENFRESLRVYMNRVEHDFRWNVL